MANELARLLENQPAVRTKTLVKRLFAHVQSKGRFGCISTEARLVPPRPEEVTAEQIVQQVEADLM